MLAPKDLAAAILAFVFSSGLFLYAFAPIGLPTA
jgi:hypothetical protein